MTNQEEEEAEAELNLWIQVQMEQEHQDQQDLRNFHEMREEYLREQQAINKAKRQYFRLVKKYVNSLS